MVFNMVHYSYNYKDVSILNVSSCINIHLFSYMSQLMKKLTNAMHGHFYIKQMLNGEVLYKQTFI